MCMPAVAFAATAIGHISYVTTKHAFLEEGTEEGIHLGDVLTLQGARRTCKVDAVSDHHARCAGDNLPRRGRFVIPHPAVQQPVVEQREFFGPVNRNRIHQVQTALTNEPFTRIGVQTLSARVLGKGYASVSHDVYQWFGSQPRGLQGERLELAARIAPLSNYRQLVAALRMTALYWTQQTMLLRYDNGTPAQFYLWQGDVSARGRQDHYTFGVGRTLTWNTPGLSVLDGAQVGYKNTEGTFEIGAFGGMIPFPGLALNTGHLTGGIYMMFQETLGKSWVLRDTTRLAYVQVPNASAHAEIETRAELTYGARLQLGITPRLGYAFQNGKAAVDAIRADGAFMPIDKLHIYGAIRYATGSVDTYTMGIVAPPNILRTMYFSDVSVMYQMFPWMGLGALNVIAHDNASGQQRISAGPQLSFPGLFGRWGDLSGTFLYEYMDAPGATAQVFGVQSAVPGYGTNLTTFSGFLQSLLTPSENINIWLRVVWISDPLQQQFLQQLAYYLRAEAILLPWLDVDGFVRVNEALPNTKVFLPLPVNILGSIQLVAHI